MKIEDDSSINVWKDPWLRDSHNLRLATPTISKLENLKVKDLFAPTSFEWNYEMLEELFLPRDV